VADSTYDVFVSYSRADARHASEIDSVLRAKGLRTFFDRRNLAPGLPWIRALEGAIGAAKATIVLIGPRGLGNTQQYERDLALIRQTHNPTFPVVPVILPGTTSDPPFDFLRVLTWIDFSHVARVFDAPDVLERLLAAIHGRESEPEAAREALCPYRGLDAFREEDSAFFFGRGSADDPKSPIGELICKVREHPFVMVVGRSGSGKSSLVYAGLLPALRRERDRFWNILSLRPGATPLRALAAVFNPRADDEGAAEYAQKITNEANKLRTGDPELLSHIIRQELDQAEGKPDRLLLYIDQWEELYAQTPSSSDMERAAQHTADVSRFIDLVMTVARTAPVAVVATVRADFYDRLIAHQEIKSLLPTRQVLLGKMLRSDLEPTIVEPARKVGLTFDPPSLVQRILDEAGEDEGMLPLLQYALKETWARREGKRLTGDSYMRSGGVREAIRTTAERTFEALSPADQQVARQLFLRLVTPGEGQEDTRARAAMPVNQAQRKIVEQFAAPRTRLLVTGYDRAARPTVEVAHEALIRTWPRLRQWIDSNREKLRARAAILQAKADWEQNGRRDDMLLPAGLQLERARSLLADPGDITTDDIKEFISRSSSREEAARREREEMLAREQARLAEMAATQERMAAAQARTAHVQRNTKWALTAMAIAVAVGLGVGFWQHQTMNALRASLAKQELALESGRVSLLAEHATTEQLRGNLNGALRLAALGVNLDLGLNQRPIAASPASAALAVAVAQSRWRLILSGHTAQLSTSAFSPDGSRIVTASWDMTARIWNTATGEAISVLRGHDAEVNGAAFSPDGSRVVTASWDKTARIWNATTGTVIAVLRGHEGQVNCATFSPDGSRIVTASWDMTARIWNATTGTVIAVLRGHEGQVNCAAFSPDGSRIVTASWDMTTRIWNATTGTLIAVLREHEAQVDSAAFSPDGSRIVTASGDQTARVWDAATGEEIAVLRGHEDQVKSAVFNSDGLRIVTASGDQTARIWDTATGKELAVLNGHDAEVNFAAFSPEGSRIVTASSDQTARIWDAARREDVVVLRGHDAEVTSAAFSPQASTIVTASWDTTARIWDAGTAKEIVKLSGHEAEVNAASFSSDGLRIVTASGDQTARVWNATTGTVIAVLRGHEGQVNCAAFSPDGSRIVTASFDQTARVWDAATGNEIAVLRGHQVNCAAFSPDGSRIVTASLDGTARTWDAASAKGIAVLDAHAGQVNSAAFSPDGSRIVTALVDHTARIWDAGTGNEIAVLRGHAGSVSAAAFSPDGLRIVTASLDKTARIWDAASVKGIAISRGHEDNVVSAAFSSDGLRIVTASYDKTARIWDARFAVMSTMDLLTEACTRRLGRLSKLTRDEMRLAGYPDSKPQIDACANSE
jgi:WD40 repeat protein